MASPTRGSRSPAHGRALRRVEDLGVARARRDEAEARDRTERWDNVEPRDGADRDAATGASVQPASGRLDAFTSDLPDPTSRATNRRSRLSVQGTTRRGSDEHRELEPRRHSGSIGQRALKHEAAGLDLQLRGIGLAILPSELSPAGASVSVTRAGVGVLNCTRLRRTGPGGVPEARMIRPGERRASRDACPTRVLSRAGTFL
jgi:hypothetical protein